MMTMKMFSTSPRSVQIFLSGRLTTASKSKLLQLIFSGGRTLITYNRLWKAYNTENKKLGQTGTGRTYKELQRDPSKENLLGMLSILRCECS